MNCAAICYALDIDGKQLILGVVLCLLRIIPDSFVVKASMSSKLLSCCSVHDGVISLLCCWKDDFWTLQLVLLCCEWIFSNLLVLIVSLFLFFHPVFLNGIVRRNRSVSGSALRMVVKMRFSPDYDMFCDG